MCELVTAITAASAVVGAGAAIKQGQDQQAAADYNAQVASQNAQIASQNGEAWAKSVEYISAHNAAIDDQNVRIVEQNRDATLTAIDDATAYNLRVIDLNAALSDATARDAEASALRAAGWDAAKAVARATGMEADAGTALAKADAADRMAGIERTLAGMDADRQRRQTAEVVGHARALYGKNGLSAGGSVADVLAATEAAGEMEALKIEYQGDVRAWDQRVSAALSRRQAASDLYGAGVERAGAALSVQQGQQDAAGIRRKAQTTWLGYSMDAERIKEQAATDKEQASHTADVTAARLRDQAAWTRWQGEVDAANARHGAATQAWNFRSDAAIQQWQGSNAATAGWMSAGATLLNAGAQLATSYGGSYTSGVRASSTGRLIGGT